jgi:deoxycytidylate deaminase
MTTKDKFKQLALNNGHDFHVVAWAKVGGSIITGVNTNRCSSRFSRTYPDGSVCYDLHAEIDLILKLGKRRVDEIRVARYKKDGAVTMAKPCRFCEVELRRFKVRRVHYTNWLGAWTTIRM